MGTSSVVLNPKGTPKHCARSRKRNALAVQCLCCFTICVPIHLCKACGVVALLGQIRRLARKVCTCAYRQRLAQRGRKFPKGQFFSEKLRVPIAKIKHRAFVEK